MKKYSLVAIAGFIGIILVAQGCKEDPSSVGLGLVSRDFPTIRVDTMSASSYSTVPTKINTSGSDRLLLGTYLDYTAISILRFTSLPLGAMDTVTITGAHLELHPVYHFGDAAGSLSFSGYRLIASTDSATYDSLTTMAAHYYSPNSIVAFPPTTVDDTTTIQCPIDTAVVHSWFTTDSTAQNYGVILIPTGSSTIKGFGSFTNATSSNYPTLVIDYTNNGVPGTARYSAGTAHFAAHIDQAVLQASDPQSMFTQSGVAYRAQLEFNLRSLPKAGLILKANLELTFNPTPSNLNSFAADTLYAYFVNPDSTIASLPVQGQTIISPNKKIYQFAVGNYVRAWANGDTLQKIQFGGLRESSSLDLFALYGTLSPNVNGVSVTPRLILTTVAQ